MTYQIIHFKICFPTKSGCFCLFWISTLISLFFKKNFRFNCHFFLEPTLFPTMIQCDISPWILTETPKVNFLASLRVRSVLCKRMIANTSFFCKRMTSGRKKIFAKNYACGSSWTASFIRAFLWRLTKVALRNQLLWRCMK